MHMDVNALPVSPEDLYARLGTAKAPLLIDVRRREAFDASQLLIIGAGVLATQRKRSGVTLVSKPGVEFVNS